MKLILKIVRKNQKEHLFIVNKSYFGILYAKNINFYVNPFLKKIISLAFNSSKSYIEYHSPFDLA